MRLAAISPWLLVLVVACAPPGPPVSLSCSSDSDCAAGHTCVKKTGEPARCEAADAGRDPLFDASAPDDAGGALDAGVSIVDAAQPDAGREPDAGPLDAGPLDAGPSDGGGVQSEADWPALGWSHRRRLRLSAPDDDVREGAPIRVSLGDTNSLMSDDRALASGDDLRVWHFDGQRWRERARVLAQAGNAGGFRGDDAGAPLVMVRAARAIPKQTADEGYWLYYGNDNAGAPPTAGVPAQRSRLVEALSVDSTVSSTAEEVASVTVQPSALGELWVIIATWQQSYDSLGPAYDHPAGGVQLFVDGAPLVANADQSARTANGRWHAGVAMTALRGASSSEDGGSAQLKTHIVALRYRAVSFQAELQPASIQNVRLLAFVLPTRSDEALLEQALPVQSLVGDLATQQRASAWSMQIPARPTGPHLWLGYNLVHESPGDSAGNLYLSFDDQAVRSSQESWLHETLFHSLFQAAVVSLDVPHTAELEYVASANNGSEVAGLTQVFLPLDGFTYEEGSDVSQTVPATGPTQVLSLNVPATTLEHEYLYLGVVGSSYDAADSVTEVTTVSVERQAGDAVQLAGNEYALDRGKDYVVSVGVAARELRSSAAQLRVLAHTTSATVPARVESPSLMWLRYPEVSTDFGEEQLAP